MELKHSGNRIGVNSRCFTFNRTSMELKPVSNDNYTIFYGAFNRTSMELKQGNRTAIESIIGLLIEPVWN